MSSIEKPNLKIGSSNDISDALKLISTTGVWQIMIKSQSTNFAPQVKEYDNAKISATATAALQAHWQSSCVIYTSNAALMNRTLKCFFFLPGCRLQGPRCSKVSRLLSVIEDKKLISFKLLHNFL